MNVLLRATRGTRPTEPVRPLDEMPEYPGRDGLPGPDGRRHGPPSLARGTYVLHPEGVADVAPHPAPYRLVGCCGPGGRAGARREPRLVPAAARVEAAR